MPHPDDQTSQSHLRRWWLAAAVIACAGAAVLIYFWREARPLWVDEEMLGLNARDRSFTGLVGPLWLGQAAPLGWMALERTSMLTFGLSERAVRALPVLWGLLTLATVVWVGRRWLGPVGAGVLALLFSFGNHVWFFALELKQYSADTFGGLMLPALAARVIDVPVDDSDKLVRRADSWWIAAGVMQWLSYGALFVAPGCALVLFVAAWRRAGARLAIRTAALSAFWLVCVGLHYYVSIRHASHSTYLREYWVAAFPPVSAGVMGTLRWIGGRFDALSNIPGGTKYALSFWVAAVAGLVIGSRDRLRAPLAMMLATAPPSAFLLALCRLVPLSGRLSLWMLPALYLGIAIAAETAVLAMVSSSRRKRWLPALLALVCTVMVARLCFDVFRTGERDIMTRPSTTHSLDDRAAVRSLAARRHPGDAMLATHLGLPAIWWYADVDLSGAAEGASFADDGPIFEVWHAPIGRDCSSDDLKQALSHVAGAATYLGFELEDHLESLVLNRLAEIGAITSYRLFAETGHAALIDLRQPPTGSILLPGEKRDPRQRPAGCVTIKRAHRW